MASAGGGAGGGGGGEVMFQEYTPKLAPVSTGSSSKSKKACHYCGQKFTFFKKPRLCMQDECLSTHEPLCKRCFEKHLVEHDQLAVMSFTTPGGQHMHSIKTTPVASPTHMARVQESQPPDRHDDDADEAAFIAPLGGSFSQARALPPQVAVPAPAAVAAPQAPIVQPTRAEEPPMVSPAARRVLLAGTMQCLKSPLLVVAAVLFFATAAYLDPPEVITRVPQAIIPHVTAAVAGMQQWVTDDTDDAAPNQQQPLAVPPLPPSSQPPPVPPIPRQPAHLPPHAVAPRVQFPPPASPGLGHHSRTLTPLQRARAARAARISIAQSSMDDAALAGVGGGAGAAGNADGGGGGGAGGSSAAPASEAGNGQQPGTGSGDSGSGGSDEPVGPQCSDTQLCDWQVEVLLTQVGMGDGDTVLLVTERDVALLVDAALIDANTATKVWDALQLRHQLHDVRELPPELRTPCASSEEGSSSSSSSSSSSPTGTASRDGSKAALGSLVSVHGTVLSVLNVVYGTALFVMCAAALYLVSQFWHEGKSLALVGIAAGAFFFATGRALLDDPASRVLGGTTLTLPVLMAPVVALGILKAQGAWVFTRVDVAEVTEAASKQTRVAYNLLLRGPFPSRPVAMALALPVALRELLRGIPRRLHKLLLGIEAATCAAAMAMMMVTKFPLVQVPLFLSLTLMVLSASHILRVDAKMGSKMSVLYLEAGWGVILAVAGIWMLKGTPYQLGACVTAASLSVCLAPFNVCNLAQYALEYTDTDDVDSDTSCATPKPRSKSKRRATSDAAAATRDATPRRPHGQQQQRQIQENGDVVGVVPTGGRVVFEGSLAAVLTHVAQLQTRLEAAGPEQQSGGTRVASIFGGSADMVKTRGGDVVLRGARLHQRIPPPVWRAMERWLHALLHVVTAAASIRYGQLHLLPILVPGLALSVAWVPAGWQRAPLAAALLLITTHVTHGVNPGPHWRAILSWLPEAERSLFGAIALELLRVALFVPTFAAISTAWPGHRATHDSDTPSTGAVLGARLHVYLVGMLAAALAVAEPAMVVAIALHTLAALCFVKVALVDTGLATGKEATGWLGPLNSMTAFTVGVRAMAASTSHVLECVTSMAILVTLLARSFDKGHLHRFFWCAAILAAALWYSADLLMFIGLVGVYVYAGEWARTTFKLSQIGVVAVYFVVAAASVHAAIQVANYKTDGGSVSDSTMLLEEYMIDWIIANGQQAG